jgi:hypothetical protein
MSARTQVLHGNQLFVNNKLGAPIGSCGESADLAGGTFQTPQWPVNTQRTVTVSVDSMGAVSILIDGAAALVMPFLGGHRSDPADLVADCRPPTLAAGAKLFFGGSGNVAFDDNFDGARRKAARMRACVLRSATQSSGRQCLRCGRCGAERGVGAGARNVTHLTLALSALVVCAVSQAPSRQWLCRMRATWLTRSKHSSHSLIKSNPHR